MPEDVGGVEVHVGDAALRQAALMLNPGRRRHTQLRLLLRLLPLLVVRRGRRERLLKVALREPLRHAECAVGIGAARVGRAARLRARADRVARRLGGRDERRLQRRRRVGATRRGNLVAQLVCELLLLDEVHVVDVEDGAVLGGDAEVGLRRVALVAQAPHKRRRQRRLEHAHEEPEEVAVVVAAVEGVDAQRAAQRLQRLQQRHQAGAQRHQRARRAAGAARAASLRPVDDGAHEARPLFALRGEALPLCLRLGERTARRRDVRRRQVLRDELLQREHPPQQPLVLVARLLDAKIE
mmetsp:Transcript_41717/g.114979  ORF Transcript_41717/g.114979 Transcript_41717/m.114979 type:complete len:297 (-) Transcript_41717:870-1760(-)